MSWRIILDDRYMRENRILIRNALISNFPQCTSLRAFALALALCVRLSPRASTVRELIFLGEWLPHHL
jgi:hypothetical protein